MLFNANASGAKRIDIPGRCICVFLCHIILFHSNELLEHTFGDDILLATTTYYDEV